METIRVTLPEEEEGGSRNSRAIVDPGRFTERQSSSSQVASLSPSLRRPLLFLDRRFSSVIAILRAGLLPLRNKYRSMNNEYNI